MCDADLTRWPEALARRYRERGYWTEETLGGFLRERARRYAGRPAVRDERRSLRYEEFDAEVDAVARRMLRAGIAPGERVIVQIDNRVALYLVQFALFRIGAVPVMALPAHDRLELEQFCRIAEPVAIVASAGPGVDPGERAGKLAALEGPSLRRRVLVLSEDEPEPAGAAGVEAWRLPEQPGTSEEPGEPGAQELPAGPASEDLAFLQLSGGSTGVPKLIPRTHADYLYSVRESARICGLGPQDVMLVAIPAAHNYPYSSPGALGVWHAGGSVVLAARPDPGACLPLLAAAGATIVPLVPPLARVWLMAQEAEPRSFPRLRLVQSGGARLDPETARALERAFDARVQQVFGMAEGLVSYTRPDDEEAVRTRTQGLPISEADELRVVDPAGRVLGPGRVGALETRGPYTIRGYYRNARANRESFAPDGWYRTGDLVRLDREGRITVVGRAKAVINRGGEKVSPEEVERLLHADPRILDAVVEGVPDAMLGECIQASVVLREAGSTSAAQLREALREKGLAAYKLPDRVRFVDGLERTGVGKNRRGPGAGAES
ncbi:MAG: AMP-binding protein [Pseudoclavibacter sp.]|nr:AMP-binding protein [Pseudoclavibacter sp.]